MPDSITFEYAVWAGEAAFSLNLAVLGLMAARLQKETTTSFPSPITRVIGSWAG